MNEKYIDDTKKEIRSVLLTYKDLVPLHEFLKTYKNLLGQKLPSRDLGFSTDVKLLASMPDVVDVKFDPDGNVYLSGIADKASSHIQKLVHNQRTSKPNNNKNKRQNSRQPLRKWPSSLPTAKEIKPFLPGTLRAEFLELMSSNHSLTLSSFALAYHKKFNKLLNLTSGLNSLESMIKLIPELEVVKDEHNNRIITNNKRFSKCAESLKESNRNSKLPSGMTPDQNAVPYDNEFNIHESGISDDTLNEFQLVLQKCPGGIMNIHFPPLYEKVTGKPFDVAEVGYNSVADLVEILPHIFKRVKNPDDEQHWFIYPAGSEAKKFQKAKHITDNFPRMLLRQPKEDKDTYSVYLCDTTKDEDIHLSDTLINESHAESRRQSYFDNKSASNYLGKISNAYNMPFDSDSSSTNNEDFLLSNNSDLSVSESITLPINRKSSFSPDVQNDFVQSKAPDFHVGKRSKRYVKEIEAYEGSKIHLINLKNKLFMPCGELCSLLWSQKDAHFLIRRLKDKEINIPFLDLKKEDYVELFKQCLWCKVNDFEKRDSDYSSLILCPLEKAFDILNIFGHPSICLRIIMQHEMRTFNPDDEFWNEFPYEELLELNDVEKNILEEINNLCLLDLKAKLEAFKIRKLKHLRLNPNFCTKEIQRIETILNIITRRIKQIETICTQYSSCS